MVLLAPAFSVYFSLSVWTTPFSPHPCFRLQYSLDVADRLADEHVLIGLYVNMLQSNPSRLVQVWHLWGSLEKGHWLIKKNYITAIGT